MRLPSARGPIGQWCFAALKGDERCSGLGPVADLSHVDMLRDDDAQLALWALYELHYAGFDDVDPEMEWDPATLRLRRELERCFEGRLRERTAVAVDDATSTSDVADAVFGMCADDDSPGLAPYARRRADRAQLLEMLMHRSVYQLKEADPQTWVIPRLRGRAKTALLQIQYDEYGAGRPEAIHQTLFAQTLSACGLDPAYGAYVEAAPGTTLVLSNVVSMMGLHRRLRGAAVGYYAAVEATSSLPSRKISQALQRLGFGPQATHFFDEHVEADAVHEQLAARDLCGGLVAAEPQLQRDVLFGVAAYLLLEGQFSDHVLTSWADGRSSLYAPSVDTDGAAQSGAGA